MRDIKKKEKIPPKRKNRRFSNIEKQKLLSRTTDADRSEQERSLSSENAERLEREIKFVGGAGYSAGKSVARRMHTLNFRQKGMGKRIQREEKGLRTVQNETERTAQQMKKSQKQARRATKFAVKTVKAVIRLIRRAAQAAAKTIRNLSMGIASGGWIALVVLVIFCVVVLLIAAIGYSIRGDGGPSIQRTVSSLQSEYNQKIEEIKDQNPHDELVITGAAVPWEDVISLFLADTGFIFHTTLTEEELAPLHDIFWDTLEITHKVEVRKEIIENGSGQETEKEKKVLYIEIRHDSPEEMIRKYGLTQQERQLFWDYRNSEGMWALLFPNGELQNGDIVAVAVSQLGNMGGEPYWRWYGFDSHVDWCACFVSWCADQAGMLENGEFPKFASCAQQGVPWFQEHKRWRDRSYTPKSGDIVFFDWNGDGKADHVGIVERVTDGTIHTIEGNADDECRRTSYPVGHGNILGFGV